MNFSHLKTAQTQITNNIDIQTGEILSQDIIKHVYIGNAKEEFSLLYSPISEVIKHLRGPAIKTYFYLLERYKPGTFIAINKALKDEIKEFISSKSVGTVSNCISELSSFKLLIKKKNTQGLYLINPRFAFKGSTFSRNNSLKNVKLNVCESA